MFAYVNTYQIAAVGTYPSSTVIARLLGGIHCMASCQVVFKEMVSLEQYCDVMQVSSSVRWRSTVCCCWWLQSLLLNLPEQSYHLHQVNHASAPSKQGFMQGFKLGETQWFVKFGTLFWCHIVWDLEPFIPYNVHVCIMSNVHVFVFIIVTL